MDFQIQLEKLNATVVSKAAKITALNAPELKEAFTSLNKKSINSVVLDLSESKYCDSSGLSSILLGNRLSKDTNGKFILCGLQPAVFKVIQIAQLDKVLLIADNKEEAFKLI